MQKVALVTRQSSPEWVSCRSISTNLKASYLLLSCYAYQNFYLDPHDSIYDARREALRIADWQAEKVVFLDHHPHPGPLLQAWSEARPQYLPELIIHVYGDFSLNSQQWVACEKILRRFSVKFFCASPKQALLVKRFLTDSDMTSNVQVIPFPLEKKQFFWDSSARKQTRDEWNAQDATVFFYSGRLSLQKNILQLIRSFEMYQRNVQENSFFFFAGAVDDLGNPYLGKRAPEGLMSYDIQVLLKDLFPAKRSQHVQYLGILESEQLNSAYNASDVFISLSTHHDEDFGMAPAEALLTGSSCLLSDWGGFSGFKTLAPGQVRLIPVHMHGTSVAPNETEVVKSMAFPFVESEERALRAEQSQNVLSIEAVANLLRSTLSQKETYVFGGFSPIFRRLAQSFSTHPYAPLSFGRNYSGLYQEIYHDYRN